MPRYDHHETPTTASHYTTKARRVEPYSSSSTHTHRGFYTNSSTAVYDQQFYGMNHKYFVSQKPTRRPILSVNTSTLQPTNIRQDKAIRSGLFSKLKTRHALRETSSKSQLSSENVVRQASTPLPTLARVVSRRYSQSSQDMSILAPISYTESQPAIGEHYVHSRSAIPNTGGSPSVKWSPLSPLTQGFENSPFHGPYANHYHNGWGSPTPFVSERNTSTYTCSPSPTDLRPSRRNSRSALETPTAPRMKTVELPNEIETYPSDIRPGQSAKRLSCSAANTRSTSRSTGIP